uniref:Ubiquitin-like protease family profile domain-containing protein n=1 Tax=Ditylenchus dipsaci TaxID=166011 RepID=A0A915DIP6_9BILA
MDQARRTVTLADGSEQVYLNCAGCRAVVDKKGARKQPIKTLKFNLMTNEFTESVEGYNHLAKCVPKVLSQVKGVNVRRSIQAEMATGIKEKPASARVRIDNRVLFCYDPKCCLWECSCDARGISSGKAQEVSKHPNIESTGIKGPKEVLSWTASVDVFQYKILLFPIHTPGHWSLVVGNLEKERLMYFDSLHGDGTKHMNLIKSFLAEHAMKKRYAADDPLSGLTVVDLSNWLCFCPKDIPEQKNGFDCGVFICKFAECVSRGGQFDFTPQQMAGIRKEMAKEILGGELF